MPALLWWKATLRGAGSAIYLEIGFGNSDAAQPAASPVTGPVTGSTHGPPEELQVGLLTEL